MVRRMRLDKHDYSIRYKDVKEAWDLGLNQFVTVFGTTRSSTMSAGCAMAALVPSLETAQKLTSITAMEPFSSK